MIKSLKIKFILIMTCVIFIGSSLYGMSPIGEEPITEGSASRKRAAPYSGFDDEAFVEGMPSLKKPKITEENNEDVISIPAVPLMDATVRSLYNVPTITQADAPVSLLNSLPPEVLRMHVLPYLTSFDGWKLMLIGSKKLRLVMNQNEMNLAWKAWYGREKNSKADEFAQEITSWKNLYRLILDLQNVFKTLTFDETEFFQKLSHVSPAEGPLHLHIQAFLQERDGNEAEAFKLYQRAAAQNFKPAQDVVAAALYEGKLGQGMRPEQVRFDELKALVDKDCERAQYYVANALYEGKLGQDVRSGQVRFDELKTLTAQGWGWAQYYVTQALYEGKLGQDIRLEQVRFDELKALADKGWERAQEYVVDALYEGKLVQDIRKDQDRFDELKILADKGWGRAQAWFLMALYGGEIGQDARSKSERFDELNALAAQGWKEAQEYVAYAFYEKELGQDARSKQELYDELKALGIQGNKRAQDFVGEILWGGEFGQDIRPGQDRFDELKGFAEQGWKKAQEIVLSVTYDGRLDQNTRPEQERFDELKTLADKGWSMGQHTFTYATYRRELGQNKRPLQETFDALKALADQGWEDAQYHVVEILHNGGYDQRNCKTELERFVELQKLAAKGHKLAQIYVYHSIRENELGQTRNEVSLRALHQVQLLLEFFAPPTRRFGYVF